MLNDSAINEIVEADVAKHKQENSTGDQQQQNSGKEKETEAAVSDADKAALALKEQDAAKETEKQAQAEKEKEAAIVNKLLGELNVDSVEALKEKLSKKDQKVLSKEEKEKADELYEAKLRTFAVEKGLGKLDDFEQLKTLSSKKDAELIFANYLEDWKLENPDVVDEKEIQDTAKEDFEKEYKLNSTNEKIKAKGIARLAKEAGEIRSPFQSSYDTAKQRFDAENELREIFPSFVKGNQKILDELVPEKIEWFKGKESLILGKDKEEDGEQDIPVEIELTAEDRKEIKDKVNKRLESPENLLLFKDGKTKEVKESVQEYAEYLIDKKVRETGNSKLAKTFLTRGMEKGSTVGATNSFAVNQAKPGATEKTTRSKAEVEKEILEQFGRKT